jgi:hypothetical protein
MMKLLILSFVLMTQVFAHEALQTNDHNDVVKKATELSARYGSSRVLVVFDIDNTLLKARQPLGSDQWFEWQADAIAKKTPEASFASFDDLLAAQANFYQLSKMDLTQPELPALVDTLKKNGNTIFLLTSRDPSLRNVTERELKRNGLFFGDQTIMRGIPEDILEAPFKQRVSFMNGIFMTAGHHKGEALAYILKKSGKTYDAIVFADDTEKHTIRVGQTFSASNSPEVITYRYGHEDENVLNFRNSSKESINAATKGFLELSQSLFK